MRMIPKQSRSEPAGKIPIIERSRPSDPAPRLEKRADGCWASHSVR
jgi:hypothetical protein